LANLDWPAHAFWLQRLQIPWDVRVGEFGLKSNTTQLCTCTTCTTSMLAIFATYIEAVGAFIPMKNFDVNTFLIATQNKFCPP
jgi:hypothetical protein